MSILSHIRKSRQQAKEHTARLAEQDKKAAEQPQSHYRHVPTHAASDAFASAPPGWREQDRPRIVEENRRRSAMAAAAAAAGYQGATGSRVGASRLSRVSYPADDAGSPMIRQCACHSPATDLSAAESSAGSSGSGDDVDVAGPSRRLHHQVRSRRASDASAQRRSASKPARGSSGPSRDPRPPPSMRGFASIARLSLPPPPPQVAGPIPSPAPLIRRASANASSSSSSSSLQAVEPSKSSWPSTAPLVADRRRTHVSDSVPSSSHGSPQLTPRNRRTVSAAQSPRLEAAASDSHPNRPDRVLSLPPLAHHDLANVFPESAALYPPAPSSSAKTDKCTPKGMGRLVKRSRWAGSKAPAVAV
ncbi:hypothetical protein CDD80_6536 [Ophiocordyceps camponoti-rufipedis]|uniref:Uncharacterized protein n=1 Tax=Ophiocordyceps camponoti-rufipedis TaxID=2004952 RepID=A0A2C5ZGU1_9HYPO|nr:hypothetical protein CDD80_6536 [Ophiocordyceps camponoti-rufipedis]